MRQVLIVDDHPGFRRFACRVLQAEGFDVIGEAEDEASAVAEVERRQPAVVLMDVLLPGRDGFAVAERLRTAPVAGFVHKDELSAAALARAVG